jgi:hypothetical protein
MIFKNMNPNGFISRLMAEMNKQVPHLVIRFNTIKSTSEEHHCIIKCSHTRTKVLLTLSDKGAHLIGYERVANTPSNITRSYRETMNKIIDAEDFSLVCSTVKNLILTKAESLTAATGKIQGVTFPGDLTKDNVFYGIVRSVKTTEEGGLAFGLHTGIEILVSSDEIVKIPGITNAVGAYLVMNSDKEIAIMATAKFQCFIQE